LDRAGTTIKQAKHQAIRTGKTISRAAKNPESDTRKSQKTHKESVTRVFGERILLEADGFFTLTAVHQFTSYKANSGVNLQNLMCRLKKK
tara:strand:+ start:33463 stop:33732 length:270 start_codon:yes stop_codon:yes gene_type:complete